MYEKSNKTQLFLKVIIGDSITACIIFFNKLCVKNSSASWFLELIISDHVIMVRYRIIIKYEYEIDV